MPSRRRPIIVTLLSAGLLAFSLIFLTRLAASLRPPQLALSVPPWYLPVTGALWGLTGLTTAAGLFFGRWWAPNFARWGSLAFAVWYWTDRLLLVRTEHSRMAWPLPLAVTILGLGALWWALRLRSAGPFFSEERQ